MIRPTGRNGVTFSQAVDGDLRRDELARHALADRLGLNRDWAEVIQVHGNTVIRAEGAGVTPDADALWTTDTDLPLAVYTADCFGVVLSAPGAVGVAHAGWRGVASGVVRILRDEMVSSGQPPDWAALGPGIGPCCFEIGPEVAERFPGHTSKTSWGTPSVDLRRAIQEQLEGLDSWVAPFCTYHDDGWLSHRKTGTSQRLATVGWLRRE